MGGGGGRWSKTRSREEGLGCFVFTSRLIADFGILRLQRTSQHFFVCLFVFFFKMLAGFARTQSLGAFRTAAGREIVDTPK